jgi:hypothetical protein
MAPKTQNSSKGMSFQKIIYQNRIMLFIEMTAREKLSVEYAIRFLLTFLQVNLSLAEHWQQIK